MAQPEAVTADAGQRRHGAGADRGRDPAGGQVAGDAEQGRRQGDQRGRLPVARQAEHHQHAEKADGHRGPAAGADALAEEQGRTGGEQERAGEVEGVGVADRQPGEGEQEGEGDGDLAGGAQPGEPLRPADPQAETGQEDQEQRYREHTAHGHQLADRHPGAERLDERVVDAEAGHGEDDQHRAAQIGSTRIHLVVVDLSRTCRRSRPDAAELAHDGGRR